MYKLIKKFLKLKKKVSDLESNCKVYVALMSQSGENAPVANILKNTLGDDILWTYNSPGSFNGILNNGFPIGKTWCTSGSENIGPIAFSALNPNEDGNGLSFYTFDNYGAMYNDFNGVPIEIRVYP